MNNDVTTAYIARLTRFNGGMHWYSTTAAISAFAEPGMDILDYGCGIGTLSEKLTAIGCNTVGVEVNADLLSYCEITNPGLKYSLIEDEFRNQAKYDLVILNHVIGHISMPASVLTRIKNHKMKKDGRLILAIPNKMYEQMMHPYNKATGYTSDSTLVHRWYHWQLKELLATVGLRVITSRPIGRTILGVPESDVFLIGRF